MIGRFDQKIIQQCADIFRQNMPDIDDQNMPDLAAYIVLGHAQSTVEKILDGLMKQGVSIQTLLHALMESQMILLDARLLTMFNKPVESDIQALKSYIEHIHYIATSMFFIDEKNRLERAKSKETNDSQDMQTFQASLLLWKNNNKIKCTNYYKGLPVQCIANIDAIIESKESFVSLRLSHDLLRVLAMTKEKFVLVSSASEGIIIKLNVHIIGHKVVTLTSNNLVYFNVRKQLRLQPIETLEVLILRNKKALGSAEIIDFSITHLNIKMSSHLCQSLNTNEIIDVHIPLQDEITEATVWIRSIRQDKQYHVLCLELLPNAQVQRLLQKEISISQRRIIQEIKEKSALL